MQDKHINKKFKFGTVEILGYIGIIIWITVFFLREARLSENDHYVFLLGVLPNLGAAWCMTMFIKWGCTLIMKWKYSIKKHVVICSIILFLAFGSEIVHDLLLSSPFDIYDMLITVVAQISIIFIPILFKDKCFEKGEENA